MFRTDVQYLDGTPFVTIIDDGETIVLEGPAAGDPVLLERTQRPSGATPGERAQSIIGSVSYLIIGPALTTTF